MKNFKKVLALTLALAVIMSSMTVAFAASANDAKAKVLFDLGLLKGVATDGTFDAALESEADAQTALVLIGRALKWPVDMAATTDFEDVATWAEPYVAYAVEKNITNGVSATQFGVETIDGKRMVTWFLRALGYNFADAWTKNAELAVTAKLTVPTATLRDNVVGLIYEALSTTPVGGTKTLVETIVGSDAALLKVAQDAGLIAKELAVVSVTATNLKQYVIEFNKDVDKTKASTKANYTFDGADIAAGDSIAVDGKMVTVTLGTNVGNQVTKTLIVETGVGLAADYKVDLKFTDTTVPFVVKATQIAPNQIKVYFNEPVQVAAGTAFQVNNGTLSAVVGTVSATEYSVVVTLGAKITSGSHTVIVNPSNATLVKDYANFAVPTATIAFDAVVDTTAPTAVVTANSQTELSVVFSEPVTGFDNADIYHTVPAYTGVVASVDGSATNYTVTFTSNPLPTGSAVVVIAKEAVTDLFENKFGAATTYNVVVTSDATAPTVSKVEVTDENTIKVTFSEAVTGATVASNYVLKDSAGVAVVNKAYANASGNPIGTFTYASKVVTIDFAGNLAKGDYLLEVKNIKDTAVNPNTITTATYAFTIADKTKPIVQSATFINARKVVVSFSESMAVSGTGSILNAAMYTLAGSALPSGTTLTAGVNNASVIIEIPSSATAFASGVAVQVGQVADAAGNLTANLATPLTAGAAVPAAIVAGSVKATGTKTLTFELDKPLQNIVVDDFTIAGQNVSSGTYENKTLSDGSTYGAFVTLNVDTAWATDAATTLLTLATTGTIDTKDTLGTVIGTMNDNTAIDKMAPTIAKTLDSNTKYNIVAKDLGGTASKIDTIEITYTEDIFAGSVGIQTYLVEGYTVVGVALVDGDGAGPLANNVVRLTVTEKSTADTAAAPRVKQVLVIQDDLTAGNRNDKAVDTDYMTTYDNTVPTLVSATVTNALNAGVVTVTFSESMKESVAELNAVVGQFAIDGVALTTSAPTVLPVLSEDGKTLTIQTNQTFVTGNALSLAYTAGTLVDTSVLANAVASTPATVATMTATGLPTAATATLTNATTITFTVAAGTTAKYSIQAAKGTLAEVNAGTTFVNAATIADTAVANTQHLTIITTLTATGVQVITDYVITEAVAGTVTAVTLQ